ncbi:MAG: triose-phosphate isomerase [Pseudomonadota bacterium]
MTRRAFVAGNWKMNSSPNACGELASDVARKCGPASTSIDIALCPPAALLNLVAQALDGSPIQLGAQDCSEHDSGAFTGETSANTVKELGCSYVICGHSERRELFGDTNERVVAKLRAATRSGLVPIMCVGEQLADREAGRTEVLVGQQLDALLSGDDAVALSKDLVIAYEPVWAIGTGVTATPEQAQEVHAYIRARLHEKIGARAEDTQILYGGSVKPDNAAAIFSMPDIDGGLIGGASLEGDSFAAVCEAART